MFSLKKLFSKRPHADRSCRAKSLARNNAAQLGIEKLEDRAVPATVGVTKVAVLDFTGENLTTTELVRGGWSGTPAQNLTSFKSLFNSSRSWLDFNGDKVVNAYDANIAINRIVAKVRADYAPYNVNIVCGEHDAYSYVLTNAYKGDAIAIITGGNDFKGDGAYGRVSGSSDDLWNMQNNNDDIAFIFGKQSDDFSYDREVWLNQISRTISHELGHTFGLRHQKSDPSGQLDPLSHSIMSSTSSRDWNRDFVFQNRLFMTDANVLQNAHQHLSREDVLGMSKKAWMATLNPGELTIYGTAAANIITVTLNTGGTWTVATTGLNQTIALAGVDTNSFNPFDQNLTKIRVFGLAGSDVISIDTKIMATTEIYGGLGNDTVKGGGGDDVIWGNDGNDVLYGRAGNDHLFGGMHSDKLVGGKGEDHLVGCEAYEGYIRDFAKDSLYGDEEYYYFSKFAPVVYKDTIVNFRDDFLRQEDFMKTDSLDKIVWLSAT